MNTYRYSVRLASGQLFDVSASSPAEAKAIANSEMTHTEALHAFRATGY